LAIEGEKMRIDMGRIVSVALAVALIVSPAFAVDNAKVDRVDATRVTVSWSDPSPVSVYVSNEPTGSIGSATLVAKDNATGTLSLPLDTLSRHYVLLRAKGGSKVTRVAEREVPLQQGSNFRDLGGYAAADSKTIKWGKIFRSGAMPLLTEADYAELASLKLGSIIDMRSLDEREIAPTQLDDRAGALYITNDYTAKAMFAANPPPVNGKYSSNLYENFPTMFVPQYRAIFNRLLADDGAVVYNCSAGQDRTGTATALVLTALGVSRDVIMKDYHLSTALRRPQFELPPIKAEDYPGNGIAQYYAAFQKRPQGTRPDPLFGPDGVAYLTRFFEVIESKYGSVDAYLEKEIGLTQVKRARLLALYLE
jgi:protein-tyrosine phosphatase